MDISDIAPERFLGDYLFNESPARLVVVGQLAESLLSRQVAGVEVHRVSRLRDAESLIATPIPASESKHEASSSLVLQLNADCLEPQQRLGRAVRACPHRVLVHCQDATDAPVLADDVFFALGFRQLTVVPGEDQSAAPVRWFEYRLSQYKASPEWLNARFWANPDRFDADEDPDGFIDDDEEE